MLLVPLRIVELPNPPHNVLRSLTPAVSIRVGDNKEVIPVLISTIRDSADGRTLRRSLDGYFEALLNHFWLHRLCEVLRS